MDAYIGFLDLHMLECNKSLFVALRGQHLVSAVAIILSAAKVTWGERFNVKTDIITITE
jgi:hypothetical protein